MISHRDERAAQESEGEGEDRRRIHGRNGCKIDVRTLDDRMLRLDFAGSRSPRAVHVGARGGEQTGLLRRTQRQSRLHAASVVDKGHQVGQQGGGWSELLTLRSRQRVWTHVGQME